MSAQTLRCIRCADQDPLIPVDAMAAHMWDLHGVLEVRWGYTLYDLQQLAWRSVRRWGPSAADVFDMHQAAYDAILDMLIDSEAWPNGHDLVGVGRNGISASVWRNKSTHGVAHGSRENHSGPRFVAYWLGLPSVVHSHEDRIVERMTLPALLAGLSRGRLRVVTALAATDGDYREAQALLGLSDVNFRNQLTTARKICAALWHEGETPHRTNREPDRRQLRHAQPCGTLAAAQRHRKRREKLCELCAPVEVAYDRDRKARRKLAAASSSPDTVPGTPEPTTEDPQ